MTIASKILALLKTHPALTIAEIQETDGYNYCISSTRNAVQRLTREGLIDLAFFVGKEKSHKLTSRGFTEIKPETNQKIKSEWLEIQVQHKAINQFLYTKHDAVARL